MGGMEEMRGIAGMKFDFFYMAMEFWGNGCA